MTKSRPRLLPAVTAERRAALRVVLRQGIAALAVTCAVLPAGRDAALSALAGAAAGVVATGAFALALFRHAEGASPTRVVWRFYLGQALKVGLTIGLLAIAFRVRLGAPWAVLLGYGATQVAFWFSPRGLASRWTG
jgi:ATP synthase protein I